MESVDKGDSLFLSQTWQQNYEYVKGATKMSHVMQYGDKSFLNVRRPAPCLSVIDSSFLLVLTWV